MSRGLHNFHEPVNDSTKIHYSPVNEEGATIFLYFTSFLGFTVWLNSTGSMGSTGSVGFTDFLVGRWAIQTVFDSEFLGLPFCPYAVAAEEELPGRLPIHSQDWLATGPATTPISRFLNVSPNPQPMPPKLWLVMVLLLMVVLVFCPSHYPHSGLDLLEQRQSQPLPAKIIVGYGCITHEGLV